MKTVKLVGLGPGGAEHMTLAAVDALRAADVVFLLDKGAEQQGLAALRRAALDRARPGGGCRVAVAESPERRVGPATKDGYAEGIEDWRRRRRAAVADLLDRELREGETGAFLVWGDPCLYDGMIGTLEDMDAEGAGIAFEVIPGVSSVQALTAAHRVPLNRIGESIAIVTARQLEAMAPEAVANHVVMLDGRAAFRGLVGEPLDIWWGAYLGTPDERLVSGPLEAAADRIAAEIERGRATHGWIMDVYLLRRRGSKRRG